MNLKKSFANKGLILNDLKRHWWAITIEVIALFITMPLVILQQSKLIKEGLRTEVWIPGEVMCVVAMVFSFVISMLIFRYMHKKRSNILIHSLPIKREAVYNSHIISGIIMILIPISINLVLSIILNKITGIEANLPMEYIYLVHGVIMLIQIMVYVITSAVASFTGFTIAQGIFAMILSVLSIALGQLINLNLSTWLIGFGDYYISPLMDNVLFYLSPLVVATQVLQGVMFNHEYSVSSEWSIIVVVYIIVFYIIGLIAYKKRKSEKTETLITFKWLEPIVKYGFVFCVMLSSITLKAYDNQLHTIVLYVVSSIIAYLIAEVIINKSLDAVKKIKGYIPYALVMAMILGAINFDVFGYEKMIPEVSNIKNALISSHYSNNDGFKERFTYNEAENIQNIRAIHEAIVKDIGEIKKKAYLNQYTESIYLSYNLKNGKTIKRTYDIPVDVYNKYLQLYDNIYSTMEYKKKEYKIFDMEDKNTNAIFVSSNLNEQFRDVFIDSKDIINIMDILRDEIMMMTAEDIRTYKDYGTISIEIKQEYIDGLLKEHDNYDLYQRYGIRNGRIAIPWKRSFVKLNKYLDEKGSLDKALVGADKVDYISITRSNDFEGRDTMKIEDKKQIDECLKLYEPSNDSGKEYYDLGIKVRNDERHFIMHKEKAPKFVRDYFKE